MKIAVQDILKFQNPAILAFKDFQLQNSIFDPLKKKKFHLKSPYLPFPQQKMY
jgi:hypothetical protein